MLILANSCKKEEHAASTGKEESTTTHHAETEESSEDGRRLEFSKLLESARKSFDTHDISSALTALEEAGDLYEAHPDLLNLRGSCHVELRDFEKALADFSQALKKMPNSPAIHFNIGEVHFVTKRWDDAIQSFIQAKDRLDSESGVLRQLIDFKLMLCEAGRGNRDEFEARADANSQVKGTLLSEYTNVVRAFQAKDAAAAREAMNEISGAFPNAEVRAPWEDTLTEFGYVTAAVTRSSPASRRW
jgi:tetratricopeptide (TPR) repeat protein